MDYNYADSVIRRSRLFMPANVRKFVDSAYLRNADTVILDLEDSVPESEKVAARNIIKELIPVAGRGGSEVFVRVNNTQELLKGDLEGSVWPGISGIYLPMVEAGQEVKNVERIVAGLEHQRGIPEGQVKISIAVETVRGYLNVQEIAQASERCDALSLGNEDFALSSGMESSDATAVAWLMARMQIVFVARAYGKIPLLGSFTNFRDANAFESHAITYYKHGYLGASCIHPGHVETLNKTFSPSKEEVEHSQKVIDAFEKGLAVGRASVSLEGKMIDYVHYKRAKKVFERSAKIKEFELKKKQAREVAGGGISK
ncbi:MAG TPA: CoA ester lyase [Nitrospirota bacterium]|nr:CoA ester lyase [Nitrospirota bacterium]